MITDYERDYYIGASDTHYVMGSYDTETFRKWWAIKQGLAEGQIDNIYTRAGTLYETAILDFLNIEDRDAQKIIGRLRVNLDGMTDLSIIECKTYQLSKGFKLTKAYKEQVQVEMYAFQMDRCIIAAYGLLQSEYELAGFGITNPCEADRLDFYPFQFDEEWIMTYLPRLHYLEHCLDNGVMPSNEDYEGTID